MCLGDGIGRFMNFFSVRDVVRATNHTWLWEQCAVIQCEKISALIFTYLPIEAMRRAVQKFINLICNWSTWAYWWVIWNTSTVASQKIINSNVDEWSSLRFPLYWLFATTRINSLAKDFLDLSILALDSWFQRIFWRWFRITPHDVG